MPTKRIREKFVNLMNDNGFIENPLGKKYIFCCGFKIIDEFVFMVGFEESSLRHKEFTCAFNIGLSHTWNLKGFDSPGASNRRIGALMTDEEKIQWAPEKYQGANIKDVWWQGYSTSSLVMFKNAFEVSIDRFLDQPDLLAKVKNSTAQQRIKNAVIHICRAYDKLDCSHVVVNPKVKMNVLVDEKWYKTVSAIVQKEEYNLWRRPAGIKAMAEYSWLYDRYQK